ncbi:MAG: hypothetical protein A3J74_02805 [Elusimicrobia bacterium RIFCSPHIGHO2_02_FULL_57_9]|nr:MAG: hypothetical protein A3J74_02805 [Elusimicrobia bacterium RIFCSPHIGHO2_02_FULL_57_9]
MRKHLTAGILLLGMILRLGYCWSVWPKELPNTDNYTLLASSFADTWSLAENGELSAHREPAYPLLLGLGFKLFGKNYGVVMALNCLLGGLTLLLICKAGELLFSPAVGLISLVIAAIYPPFIYYSARPIRETLIVFMASLCVLTLISAVRHNRPAGFITAGLANALAGLTTTPFLPFGLIMVPLTLAILAAWRRLRNALWIALYLAAFAALYFLWPLRNYMAFGTWVISTVGSGAGNNFYEYQIVPQELSGTPAHRKIISQDPVMQASGKLPPIEQEQFLWKAGRELIKQKPSAYVKLVAWRFLDLYRLVPNPRSYDIPYSTVYWVSALTNGWIIPLGLLGIVLARARPPELLLIYSFLFSLSFTFALVFTLLRYRLPLMPWLIILAASTLQRAWRRICAQSG